MFQFPLNNNVLTCRFVIYNPFGNSTMHYGMDFGCGQGTSVYAANSGQVVLSTYDSAGGNMIAILDAESGEMSRYAHLKTRGVKLGDFVSRGALIGYSGNTGTATTGPHLHFETWIVPKGYTYKYSDRTKYAVDPMSVCHLMDGQTFNANGLSVHDPIPYPDPKPEKLTFCDGVLKVVDGTVRIRLFPEVTKYQYVVGGYNRGHDVLKDFFTETEFTIAATCANDGYDWALANTPLGQFWVAELKGKTEILTTGEPASDNTPDKTEIERKVIDISEFQNALDWNKAKADGVEGAILRVGFRGYGSSGTLKTDSMFENHYAGAIAAGVPVGVYFFTQAKNSAEGKEEAEYVIKLLADKKITYPVFIDSEMANNGSGRADGISKADRTAACVGFCEAIKAAGYMAGVYASLSWYEKYLDINKLKPYELWIAHYTDYPHPEYRDTFCMWQYTSKGTVAGATGNIDINHCYKNYLPVNTEADGTNSNQGEINQLKEQISLLAGQITSLEAEKKELSLTVDSLRSQVAIYSTATAEWEKKFEISNSVVEKIKEVLNVGS